MQRCAEEIRQLRKSNAELAPKADAYDALLQVLNMIPQPSRGYGEDLVWKLEKEIAELQEADQAKPVINDDAEAE